MDTIYMNNFRGFKEVAVPIRRVNFFVGENSTGKTSLLALLDLFSKPEFWFNLDFNTGSYEFGGYKDIVSVSSDDQEEFQIGLCRPNQKQPERSACYMIHFSQAKNGLPQLVRFSQLCGMYHATMQISNRQVAVQLSTDVPPFADCSVAEKCFRYLHDTVPQIDTDYKKLPDDVRGFLRRTPIANFPSILSLLFKDSEFLKRFDSFPFPGLRANLASMAPIRTTPKRTYDGYTKRYSPDGEHTPYVIRKRLPRGKKNNAFKEALEAFGKDSGLFETVGVTQFGKDSSAPFELTVTLSSKALRINSVGYGVSQALPVVVELLTRGKTSWIAIQQPEVHLHPKAQAALGDVLFHAAIDQSQVLFVETHSDYLLDRFRLAMRNHEHPDDFAQVVFFERSTAGNQVFPMVINKSGEYPQDQPPGFRAFFLAEQKRILGV